jgi:nitrile hydratase accessory protein
VSDTAVDPRVAGMSGTAALPRSNGELVFGAPWEGRAFAMAIGVVDALGLDWEEFRRRLIAAIDADPERPYYESWLAALERLAADHDLTAARIAAAVSVPATVPSTVSDHDAAGPGSAGVPPPEARQNVTSPSKGV